MATRAVFNSWFGKRAIDYRNATNISHDLGTAVNIVTMVFGNMGDDSATGVAFTRNPVDGAKELYGDYLINAQGEDVVAGIRNTLPIAQLKADMPEAFGQFMDIVTKLENHFQDMQDVEFTIEHHKLWMLQTRNGKRTARAAIKMAVDMSNEGLIDKPKQAWTRDAGAGRPTAAPAILRRDRRRAQARKAAWSPKLSMRARAPRSVWLCLTPTPPPSGAKPAKPSSWSAQKPSRMMSTA
jgi:hypothetical protein